MLGTLAHAFLRAVSPFLATLRRRQCEQPQPDPEVPGNRFGLGRGMGLMLQKSPTDRLVMGLKDSENGICLDIQFGTGLRRLALVLFGSHGLIFAAGRDHAVG